MPKLTTADKLSKLKKIEFTKKGYEKLLNDLERLRLERPAAVKELARARELGDLSENGLYTAAKSKLSSIDNQIFKIEMTMKFAVVVDSKKSEYVNIGSRVKAEISGRSHIYEIVGDTEANPAKNMISKNSPIGNALMGKFKNDTVMVELPTGIKEIKILDIY